MRDRLYERPHSLQSFLKEERDRERSAVDEEM